MGFFDSEIKEAPGPEILETPWGPENRGFLQRLIRRDVKFPTQQIPGMTGIQKRGQTELQKIIEGGTFEDPSKSLLYRGFRDESRMDEEKAVSGLRRRQQLMGMFASTPALREEGETRSRYGADRSQFLGLGLGTISLLFWADHYCCT